MVLHFAREEYDARVKKTLESMEAAGIDGLLMFRQESMYYLTGYDTTGFVMFQCLVLRSDGRMALLTRSADLRQAAYTSTIEDVRVWVDSDTTDPYSDLARLVGEMGLTGKRIGVELEAYGLNAAHWEQLKPELDATGTISDASDLVTRLRLVKSPPELAFMKNSAELGDAAHRAGRDTAAAGVFTGDVLAAMQGAVFSGDGDYPATHWIAGSGPSALLVRYHTGRHHLETQDQLMLEYASSYRHYHTAQMYTVLIGEVDDEHQAMYDACREALAACEDAVRPGKTMGEVFDAHARVMDDHGFRDHRLNACGYSMGSTFPPNWMDWPMFFHGNPVVIEANMVFFLHMILVNAETDHGMALGRTVAVTQQGCESLHRAPLDLVVR
ncbi:MAG: Xaa-Pro peptidase family protein [Alphaproteobacteria bacterium]|nr:aminopeptidase P family protein [Rhodospirillaceae bacterium]MDG2481672.1 Xaa-Pro peptidase family protein [Alphaproteobacteria bacterium]MBT6204687.1 aminopeptidase P family protein [Rhodospirillaceae bacterium]MBT6512916.1 aminopeptidase P family protein [Rhodospirillaceae bacterium]MBT7615197.1 aminopeptidase P family protein [Rhodospirillaceae bacterium]